MKLSREAKRIFKEVKAAYTDCWDHDGTDADWDRVANLRNLHFRASGPVTREEAVAIMMVALQAKDIDDCSYNEFTPDVLNVLPADCQIVIAREGSVCMYLMGFQPSPAMVKTMKADESMDYDSKGWRLWWD